MVLTKKKLSHKLIHKSKKISKKYIIDNPNYNNKIISLPTFKKNDEIKKPLFISLGFNCGARLIMDRCNIIQPTFPFDWTETYFGVSSIIEKGYAKYNLIQDNKVVLDLINGIAYHHDNKDDIKEKYNRRLTRLHQYLSYYDTSKNNKEVIFIRKSHSLAYHNHYYVTKYNIKFKNDIKDAKELHKFIKNKYPNLNYKIYVYLMCDKCYNKYNYKLFKINENIIVKRERINPKISFDTLSLPFKKMFYSIIDNLNLKS